MNIISILENNFSVGRHVMKGQKGTPIQAPMIGSSRQRDEKPAPQADKPAPRLIGSRTVYVFENYLVICGRDFTRSMRLASRCSERTLDSSNYIIAQFFGPAQRCFRGKLSTFFTWL
jgi:hypothetical protein